MREAHVDNRQRETERERGRNTDYLTDLSFECRICNAYRYFWVSNKINIYIVAPINSMEIMYKISIACINHVTKVLYTVSIMWLKCTVYCIDHVIKILYTLSIIWLKCTVHCIDHVTEILYSKCLLLYASFNVISAYNCISLLIIIIHRFSWRMTQLVHLLSSV